MFSYVGELECKQILHILPQIHLNLKFCHRNPRGRTGLKGRGLLGRYGPNHAADPIVTRWKMDEFGNFVLVDEKKVLEFIAVKRNDTGDWAIPGVREFLLYFKLFYI